VSCWNPFDNYGEEYDRAADKYFGSSGRPTIAESVAYYRERKIGLVMFMVDAESNMGRRRIPNEEIAEAREEEQRHHDCLRQHRSAQGKDGRARGAPAHRGARREGLQVPPDGAGLPPLRQDGLADLRGDRRIRLPAIFHTGHSGIGSGMRCGGGLRLEYSNPMHLDDVAIDFPDMQIVMAHPSFPWQDEALSVATHKPNVWIDLSGWSPKYFPKQLVQYANTLLKDRILFGSDYPLITPDRWMKDFEVAGFKPEVMPGILKGNAVRLLTSWHQTSAA
jgi:predicted TIM-barrel fold metal-dependent hydrolase